MLTDSIEQDKLRTFFANAGQLSWHSAEAFEKANRLVLTSDEQRTQRRLIGALCAISISAVLSAIGAAMLHDGLRKCLMAVSALLPFALFALYVLFPRYLLIRRERGQFSDNTKWNPTVDMDLPLLITVFAEGLLCFYGTIRFYNLFEAYSGRWAMLALIPFAAIMTLLLTKSPQIRNSEWKDSLYTAALCVIYAGMACFCGVYLLNGALDFAAPKVCHAEIIDKWAYHEGEYRNIPSYYIDTERPYEVYQTFRVSFDQYESARKGDAVTVEEHRGGLGIPYEIIQF